MKGYFHTVISDHHSNSKSVLAIRLFTAFCLKSGLTSKISYRYRIHFENLTLTHLYNDECPHCDGPMIRLGPKCSGHCWLPRNRSLTAGLDFELDAVCSCTVQKDLAIMSDTMLALIRAQQPWIIRTLSYATCRNALPASKILRTFQFHRVPARVLSPASTRNSRG